ncbi:core-2/I-branching enzyme [Streptococcus suis]|uniref:Peptide O-xylosyltransferase n=1 Tax=Streptococcus suis TaxID=1307 RepID=A0A4T2GQI6_STRSU|nr:core-2/I-branching enzyme [Streptococcus suis]MBM7268752.1 core-2/I-branching enzyme [Streptococcus suis]MBM7269534.1 core-2/I-branching enzyme [Streptococcus suis]TII00297.1 core-2/I-branching enzyme [Streptococcus suis]TII00807.1 core-2/I-branching enzyme [Streptococcus suis]
MTTKHAYLILAHSNFKQLGFLIQLLDHERNDIFIHIDQKTVFDSKDEEQLRKYVRLSSIYFVPRVGVYWGGVSQIIAEMNLFKIAAQTDHYAFYHLLSGVDLPLSSQEDIHLFFDQHADKNFLTIMAHDRTPEDVNRIKYYHFFESFTPRTIPGLVGKALFRIYRALEVWIQKLLRVDRINKFNLTLVKASQWVSLPSQTVSVILQEEDWLKRVFKHSFLCDELFIPMVLEKNGLLDQIYFAEVNNDQKDEFQGSLHFNNWWDGKPYTWQSNQTDFAQLQAAKSAGYLFARKFAIENDEMMKEFIIQLIQNEEQVDDNEEV